MIKSFGKGTSEEYIMEQYLESKLLAMSCLATAESFILISVKPVIGSLAQMSVTSALANVDPEAMVKELRATADKLQKLIEHDKKKEG